LPQFNLRNGIANVERLAGLWIDSIVFGVPNSLERLAIIEHLYRIFFHRQSNWIVSEILNQCINKFIGKTTIGLHFGKLQGRFSLIEVEIKEHVHVDRDVHDITIYVKCFYMYVKI